MSKIRIGDSVKVRPSLFEPPSDLAINCGYAGEPIWCVVGIDDGGGIHVLWRWPVTLRPPPGMKVRPDDVIACEFPRLEEPAWRDPNTGLTWEASDALYRQRRDAHLRGEPCLPCVGWNEAEGVYVTPHGPVTAEVIRAWEGHTFEAVPEAIRPQLLWLSEWARPFDLPPCESDTVFDDDGVSITVSITVKPRP